MRESDILYETGVFWVCRARDGRKGYEVYRVGVTHSTRCAIIGYESEEGVRRARAEADKRAKAESPEHGAMRES